MGIFKNNVVKGSHININNSDCQIQINGKSYSIATDIKVEIGGVYITIPSDYANNGFSIFIEGDVNGPVRVGSGDVTITGNTLEVQTGSGDISIKGDVTGGVQSGSGDIDIDGSVHGNVSSASGDIKCKYADKIF